MSNDVNNSGNVTLAQEINFMTRGHAIEALTKEFMEHEPKEKIYDYRNIAYKVCGVIDNNFKIRNCMASREERWELTKGRLPREAAAVIMSFLYTFRLIEHVGNSSDSACMFAVFNNTGDREGTYSEAYDFICKMLLKLEPSYKEADIKNCTLSIRAKAKKVPFEKNKNLVAVKNGIFDYDVKELLPFSPDHVFLNKVKVNYNPDATSPLIVNPDGTPAFTNLDGTPFNVDEWMSTLSNDPEIVDLLWKIIGAAVRNGVEWDKAVLFYATTGNNGKGTLCQLMRNILGEENCASIAVDDMGKDFTLSQLITANAIICDENPVGKNLEDCKTFKGIVTGDSFQLNRKYKDILSFRFRGFVCECFNDMPTVKDKSDSFARRLLFVPFDKSFTGRENKKIKQEFLKDKRVLEYVLWRVLAGMDDYYELPEPEASKKLKNQWALDNNSILEFYEEVICARNWAWRALPFTFLYDIYQVWMKNAHPASIKTLSERGFSRELKDVVANDKESVWYSTGEKEYVRNDILGISEPAIMAYRLFWKWGDPNSSDDVLLCVPRKASDTYRCLQLKDSIPRFPKEYYKKKLHPLYATSREAVELVRQIKNNEISVKEAEVMGWKALHDIELDFGFCYYSLYLDYPLSNGTVLQLCTV